MLVFIDDSGDPGFKLNKGSTSHFIISVNKKELPKGVFPTIHPMLVVPATPPSGDSSECKFLYL